MLSSALVLLRVASEAAPRGSMIDLFVCLVGFFCCCCPNQPLSKLLWILRRFCFLGFNWDASILFFFFLLFFKKCIYLFFSHAFLYSLIPIQKLGWVTSLLLINQWHHGASSLALFVSMIDTVGMKRAPHVHAHVLRLLGLILKITLLGLTISCISDL